MQIKEARRCRGCKAPAQHFVGLLKLGSQAVIKFKKTADEPDDFSPLELVMCSKCKLVQLSHSVNKDRLFRDYSYLSGVNASMRASLFDIVKHAESLVDVQPGDVVMDIGSNDNTLLNMYRSYVDKIGFEPARNIRARGAYIIQDYFSLVNAQYPMEFFGGRKPKIITAVAMFYDLDNPNQFCADVKKILHPDGIFVVQMNYLGAMIENLTIDNISAEHLCYYSFSTIQPILARNGLKIINISENDVNGGSIRIICRHKEHRESEIILADLEMPLSDISTYIDLVDRLRKTRYVLKNFIEHQKKEGKKIWGYGASTRGNTLLQWLDFDHTVIDKIADRNPAKEGLFTTGGNIPICSEEEMRAAQPDVLLVLPYHFRKEFIEREEEYLRKGGTMLFPLPEPEIVTQWTKQFVIPRPRFKPT